MIGRGSLSGEEECAGLDLEIRVIAQAVIQHNNTQCVQELPLIFVNALYLRVDDGVGVDRLTGGRLEPAGELLLGLMLGREKRIAKALVLGEGLKPPQLAEVRCPSVADRIGN